MNKIYISGDIHGTTDIKKLYKLSNSPIGKTMTKNDYVILLGDTAVFWGGDRAFENEMKATLQSFPWTTLIVDGNHDDHDQLQKLPITSFNGGLVGVIASDILYLRRGEIYILNEKKFWVMGGGLSVDKQWRTENINWWPGELLSKKDEDHGLKMLEIFDNKVDYILTHTCPSHFVNMLFAAQNWKYKLEDPTSKYLQHVFEITQFDKWFCGHWHIDEEFDNGEMNFLYDKLYRIN